MLSCVSSRMRLRRLVHSVFAQLPPAAGLRVRLKRRVSLMGTRPAWVDWTIGVGAVLLAFAIAIGVLYARNRNGPLEDASDDEPALVVLEEGELTCEGTVLHLSEVAEGCAVCAQARLDCTNNGARRLSGPTIRLTYRDESGERIRCHRWWCNGRACITHDSVPARRSPAHEVPEETRLCPDAEDVDPTWIHSGVVEPGGSFAVVIDPMTSRPELRTHIRFIGPPLDQRRLPDSAESVTGVGVSANALPASNP